MISTYPRIKLWLATKGGRERNLMMRTTQMCLLREIVALKSGARKGSKRITASSMKNFSIVGRQGPATNRHRTQPPITSLMPSH
jgi:hypothetical protein